jgi:bifunctional enzyme CysN/CysC
MKTKSSNITRNIHLVSLDERMERNAHRSGVLWFTGLPGSGKSTITEQLESRLFEEGYQVSVVDNETVRTGLSSDIGFSPDDRTENIRRAGEVAALLARAGRIVLSGFISPYHSDREGARKAAGDAFHEIYLDADAGVCERRDAERLYEKARAGHIAEFTGVSAPYEIPQSPELVLDTDALDVEEAIDLLADYVKRNFGPLGA